MLAAGGGPNVAVHGWAAWIVIAGMVCGALVAIWKAVVPVVRAATNFGRLESKTDELLLLVKPNGGASVLDRMERVEAQAVANGQKTEQVAAKVDELHIYSHEFRHDLVNAFGGTAGWLSVIDRLVRKVPEAPPAESPPT